MRKPVATLAAVAVSLACTAAVGMPEEHGIATYSAVYQVEYKGRHVGSAEFTVGYDPASGQYDFRSVTTARGLLKLIRPRPAIEHSRFVVVDGRIRPLEFRYEDGSRGGDDNYHVVFDWQRAVATITRQDAEIELPLRAGVLDRGTLQVALMRDAAAGEVDDAYALIDESAIERYDYRASDSETLETTLGPLTARAYVQRRAGSSRLTRLWLAPSLAQLPVRIERQRDGEVQTALILESVDGLAPATTRR